MIVWLIGLSGCGKTTIGRPLYRLWKERAPNTVFVDGDEIRAMFQYDQLPDAHTIEGRRVNGQRISELCAWLDRQDINVVCCILSLFPEMRLKNRDRFSGYFEVYLRVPMAELERRDSKGLYRAARRGEIKDVVGVDIPFPEPDCADLVIDNYGADSDPEREANHIAQVLGLMK